MLRLIAESKATMFLCCIALTFAGVRLGMEQDAAALQTFVGWLLATFLWHYASLRTQQVEYLVSELKAAGARVLQGDEEL